jgi:hypothetical protein
MSTLVDKYIYFSIYMQLLAVWYAPSKLVLSCGQAVMYWNQTSDGRGCMWFTYVRDWVVRCKWDRRRGWHLSEIVYWRLQAFLRNSLENVCIKFFQRRNTIINEQSQKDVKPLFHLIYDIRINHACAWPTSPLSRSMFDSSTLRPADITTLLEWW